MPRRHPITCAIALSALLTLPGCAAIQELAALRTLTFRFASVSNVRLAGIAIGPGSSYSSLGLADVTRLGSAVVSKQVPIELVAHLDATNPAENKVSARLVGLGWTLFVEERQALAGDLGAPVAIAPGATADVPLAVRFDLLQFAGGGARDLFDLALGIAGQGQVAKELRLEMLPTVETSLGPIRFPAPVVVRRQVGPR
jgi:hypothetical protein